MSLAYVITTIQSPTPGVRSIARKALEQSQDLIIIGDKKSPKDWSCEGAMYFSLAEQQGLAFSLVQHVPENSYARKMLGYLIAASAGASSIRETDDDNVPYESFFELTPDVISSDMLHTNATWFNAYLHFTDRFVWPRGYPLQLIDSHPVTPESLEAREVPSPFILQALADGDPDVDAIYRLTAPDKADVSFSMARPIAYPASVWCPFNSQATTWPRQLFPLMYLPVTCTFRMTDIWRSFVAQRLLSGLGATLIFTSSTVHQSRNEHDLMADFEQEVQGYLGVEKIRETLESTEVRGGSAHLLSDLRALYDALVDKGFLTHDELPVLDAWLDDMHDLGFGV